ncbi:hypothetical protein J2X76_003677 [Neorhizobium sp. 2083]|uniref:hypothetical protein n=1 Tax=Neorhizobium sp. 2083 TaxID=2817762 RepID=UPI0028658275|nr:hypothetical protein [Neorhizobium sp. 2083]MDR6818500.1 hypothetical protein [Neorhizobium sp. 2083]
MTDQNMTDGQESQQTNGTATDQGSDAAAGKQGGAADNGSAAASTITKDAGKENSAGADAGNGSSDANDAATDAEKGDLQRFREQLAGGDAGLLKQLERHKSIESISKSFKESRNAAKNAGKPLVLGEKATPDEVKAYREAMGIPDEAKDYPVAFREEFKPTEEDKEILDSFKEYLHGANADPRAAKAALEWYQDFATERVQQLNSNLAKVAKETQSALRDEWGGEYEGNLNAAQQLMTTQLGDEGFEQMMGLRLMDGSRLQDNIAFVKMMAQLGADYYGGNAIMTGDVETTAKTVEEQIQTLLKLRVDDPEKYKSDEVQSKITKLYQQRDKINARKK